MDAIQAARELGKAIQADARFIRVMQAQENNDRDKALQDQIGTFNLLRGRLNGEVQQENKDTEKIKEMDTELKAMYAEIFANKNMREFSDATDEMQEMLAFVNQIINGSAGGQDPDIIEFQQDCGGDCGGCAGCS